jgi:hypothetical protein
LEGHGIRASGSCRPRELTSHCLNDVGRDVEWELGWEGLVFLKYAGANVLWFGVPHGGMLALQDRKYRPAGLGAGSVWLQHAAARTPCEIADGCSDAARVDPCVKSSGFGLVVGCTAWRWLVEGLCLRVIDEGTVVALVPEIHPVGEAAADISGLTNPWCGLQHDRCKHQGALGGPGALSHSLELAS